MKLSREFHERGCKFEQELDDHSQQKEIAKGSDISEM